MSNLIITIISIVIVGIATAMGIFYGGTAFENGQAQAQANQIVSGMQQMVTAMNVYMANCSTSTVADICSLGGSLEGDGIYFLRLNNLMSELPAVPGETPVPGLTNYACPAGSADFGCGREGGMAFGNSEFYQGYRQ